MNWPRIKWLLIVMLLLGNLVLAGFYLTRRAESVRDDEQALNTLRDVLAERGVSLTPEVMAQLFTDARRLYAPRDQDREAGLADALLGQTTRSDLGGRIFAYDSSSGWAQFRSGGQFEVMWTAPRQTEGSPENDAALLLRAAGFPDDTPPEVRQSDDGTTVTLYQSWDGLPVFDGKAQLSYDAGGTLTALSGQWLWGDPLPAGDEMPCPVLATTLLRFSGAQRSAGTPVSTIQKAQLGYFISAGPSEYICLTPVWRLTADGRVMYADAETGAPVAPANSG